MNTNKEAKKYLNKYFATQYINEKDDEFKALVRLLNKAQQQVKNCNTPDVSVSLVDNKFMKWLAKEAPELCESLYGCIHEYETNER